jgi:PIN domain nuclease of toxin-antitoxin system
MEIVLDSHTLFWLLTDSPKLSKLAKRYIEKAEKVILPSIALMEVLYLFLHRLKCMIESSLQRPNYLVPI